MTTCELSTTTESLSGDELPNSGDYQKGVKYITDTWPILSKLPSEYVLPLTTNPLLVSHDSIPVIDLSGLNGSAESRMMTIQALDSACSEWGIFVEMLKAVVGFFNLSWEEKTKYNTNSPMNLPGAGYGTSLHTSSKYSLWRDYMRHHGHGRPLHSSSNLWPSNPSNYSQGIYRGGLAVATEVASALSEALGLDSYYIEKSLGEDFQVIGSNYYAPCPGPHRTLGIPEHSDHGGLTVLMQNDVDGLQVEHDGEWVSVGIVPGSFVINIGDYMEILSNGRYKTLKHRGVTSAQRTRISIAVGNGPGLTSIVAPASPLLDEKSEIKYPNHVTYKEYMELHQNGTIRGKSPLQAMNDLQVNK
ncbi:protein DOWNY MILDEW RESISTANCE 6-like [Cornus florida]|uniref:protein DOWNY MILDEW RESISTANCE 6-like n=1 Tax=Cornus florida TaxID=4283 RepID=UPI0028976550|nr:protein DOWNY MILDEW RESISTANCE 6-like [Cornus florida]